MVIRPVARFKTRITHVRIMVGILQINKSSKAAVGGLLNRATAPKPIKRLRSISHQPRSQDRSPVGRQVITVGAAVELRLT